MKLDEKLHPAITSLRKVMRGPSNGKRIRRKKPNGKKDGGILSRPNRERIPGKEIQ